MICLGSCHYRGGIVRGIVALKLSMTPGNQGSCQVESLGVLDLDMVQILERSLRPVLPAPCHVYR